MRALPYVALALAGCGAPPSLPVPADAQAVVLLFVQTQCPMSNAYAPEFKRLAEEFGPRGAAFVALYAEPGLSDAAAREHARAYGYSFPHRVDRDLAWVRRAGAKVVPEAAVLSPSRELIYAGRVDDRYFDYGKARPAPTTRELRDALEAALAGRRPPSRRVDGLGCPISEGP